MRILKKLQRAVIGPPVELEVDALQRDKANLGRQIAQLNRDKLALLQKEADKENKNRSLEIRLIQLEYDIGKLMMDVARFEWLTKNVVLDKDPQGVDTFTLTLQATESPGSPAIRFKATIDEKMTP